MKSQKILTIAGEWGSYDLLEEWRWGGKSKFVSRLNIANSEMFDTQTWILKQRCDQVPAGSKHHLLIIINAPYLRYR